MPRCPRCPRCPMGRLLLEQDVTGWTWSCLLCARSWVVGPAVALGYAPRSRLDTVARERPKKQGPGQERSA